MSQNNKFTDIIELLDEIKSLINNLEKKFSSIEKDIALEKLRKAYDCLLNINLNNIEIKDTILPKEIVHEEPISLKNDFTETSIIKNEEIIIEQLDVNEIITNDKAIQEPNNHQVITEEEKKIIEVELTLFETVSECKTTFKNKEQNTQSSKTISEQFRKTNTKTLSDSLQTQDNNLSSNRIHKPIKNIKSAISINDRIMFTRDLFINNNDLYNKTIDLINGMSSFEEAEILINNTIKNKDSETFNSFIELISRRFI
ncbi:MAG: hypothetical protein A2X08_13025 [Bacteroidetes bacterium GWA2_32_17]|nr:MAG: hypothetical protein A2X08_13025 [Bacteroidetes bacterium GWA2_32_17]